MQVLNTILIALDIGADAAPAKNALSDQVFETLQQLQLQQNTMVVLTHIVPTIESEVEVSADRPQADLESFPYAQLEKRLQLYQKQLPCQSETEIVTGDPAEEIVRLANIYHADLIIIGSRGLTGMQRILLGSVSSQIVTDAPCSVWVVKPK